MRQITNPAPRRRKWLLRLGLLFVLMIVLLAGFIQYVAYRASRSLQEAEAEVDRKDPGWRMLDLEASRAQVPEEQNAALHVLAAAALNPKPWPEEAQGEAFAAIDKNEPEREFNPQQQALLQTAMSKVQPALVEARKVAQCSTGRYPVQWTPAVVDTPCPHWEQVRKVAEMLGHDVKLRAQNRDLEGALVSCQALFNVGRSLGDEPAMISLLVRIACLQRALRHIERTLAQGPLDPASLARLQRCLEEEEATPRLLVAVRGERAMLHGALGAVESGDLSVNVLAALSENTRPTSPVSRMRDRYVPGAIKPEHAEMLQHLTEAVELARLPFPEQAEALHRMEARLRLEPGSIAGMVMPSLVKCAGAFQKSRACIRCGIALLAAERYRLANGKWPESLAALAPDWLPAGVAIDPFDGQPLRYWRLKNGLVIHSVGPKSNVQGNVLYADPFSSPESNDLRFQLWDPERRRQAARPPKMPE